MGRENITEDMTDEEIAIELAEYCPFCKKHITPSNVSEVLSGQEDGFVFVHDEGVEHDEDYPFGALH